MSWLANSGVPPYSTVTLYASSEKAVFRARPCFHLPYALCHGLPWPAGAPLPRPLAEFCAGDAPLEPWLVTTLLTLTATDPPQDTTSERLVQMFTCEPCRTTPEDAVAALEAARARRGLHGALLVRAVTAVTPARLKDEMTKAQQQPWLVKHDPVLYASTEQLQDDLELTMLLLAQSTNRVFVAGKQPVLERLRPDVTLEVLALHGPAGKETP